METAQCDTHLQEVLEGESWEGEACQPDLSASEGYGSD